MAPQAESAPPFSCPQCGTQVPPSFLACPSCHRLVHAEELKKASGEAQQAEKEGKLTEALASWRQVLDWLPPGSRQSDSIAVKINALSEALEKTGGKPKEPFWGSRAGKLGLFGILVFLLTKFKFLALGFSKMGTVFTMLLSFGVYWTAWGWKFAAGLVLSIYVHEMGHVAMLNHYGIKATAPMFVPGLGAFVRLKQNLANPREDARVGLAGPWWGLGASLAAYLGFLYTPWTVLGAIAKFGAWINLFNLMPLWQLDGGRGFNSLTRDQRLMAAMVVGGTWYATREMMLLVILCFACLRLFDKNAPEEPDSWCLAQYAILIAAFSALCLIPVPTFPKP